tara:strand:- start:187 stop:315 length:129 start_codon:yes stop_codon:yes gene_type:complete
MQELEEALERYSARRFHMEFRVAPPPPTADPDSVIVSVEECE